MPIPILTRLCSYRLIYLLRRELAWRKRTMVFGQSP